MGSDARGRRHPSEPWLQAGKEADPDGPAPLRRGRKLVVQIGETFGEKNAPLFVEKLDALELAEKLKLDLAPVMIYGDDVTHIVTEEGIANLLLCRDKDEREQAIRGVAGYTDVGRGARREDGPAPARARRDPPAGGSRHRSARRRPEPAGGALDQGSRPLVRRALRAALPIPELVRRKIAMETLSFRHMAPRARRRHPEAWPSSASSLPAIWRSWSNGSCPTPNASVEISTAAEGFGAVWDAVVADFVERHSPGGLKLSINDGGARPDTVSLRLAQAVRLIEEEAR